MRYSEERVCGPIALVYLSEASKLTRDTDGDTMLDRYFPLTEEAERQEARGDRDETATRKGCGAGGEGVRPGEQYKLWKGRDVLGSVPVEYMRVVERAASVAGVSEETLSVVLGGLERRVLSWITQKKRRGRGE